MINLTLSTKISILRIPLASLFFLMVWNSYLGWALFIFLFTALTDFIDGYIAKKKGLETTIGRIIDPIADRIFIVSSFFAIFFGPLNNTMSFWVFVIVVAQDVLLGILGITTFISKGQGIVRVSIPGKIATLCQEVFIPVILLKNITNYEIPLLPLEIAVIVTSMISGGHHLYMWCNIWKGRHMI